MCVIALVGLDPTMPVKRLTPDIVDKMFTHNSEGAGIAWREDGLVKWEKGLELEGMQTLCAEVPMPYVAHFRIATCGGNRQDLCHPFPIDKNAPLFTTGHTKGYVLFHNGHWGDWKKELKEVARQSNFKIQIPSGKWSDSRAMAWAAAYYGNNILEIIDEKAIAFGPEDYEVYGTGWVKEQEIWCSNNHWNWGQGQGMGQGSTSFTMCRERQCTKPKFGQWEYCVDHMCKDPTCHEIRMGYTEYCHKHQRLKTEDDSSWNTDGGSGGTLPERPFRKGRTVVSGGTDKQEEDKGGATDSVGTGGTVETSGSEAGKDNALMRLADIKKWACSINTKKINGTKLEPPIHETEAARIARLDEVKQGIINLGRM